MAAEPSLLAASEAREMTYDSTAELYRQLFLQAPEAVLVLDAEGTVCDANPRAAQLFDVALDRLRGMRFSDLHDPEWLVPTEEARRLVLAQGSARFELRLRRAGGGVFAAAITATRLDLPPEAAASMPDRIQWAVRDLSDDAPTQEQIRQAQRMESVGRLAGGIAHDFNNLLTGILGYTDLLLQEFQLPEPARLHLEEIRKAGMRAAALIRQLLAFSRRQVLRPRVLALNEVITDLEPMLRRVIGEDIDLETTLAANLAPVLADRSQMEQVIMNLVINARDAMPRGGQLRLETANAEISTTDAERYPGFRPGSFVTVRVCDSGHGMDEVTRARIFEPFFTTKGREGGSGLGLSTVYGIIKQTGGWIYVDSAPDKGSTFEIFLPPAAASRPAAEAREDAESPRQEGAETILVVEDEASLRGLVQMVLAARGYRVLEARHGREALSLFESHTEGVDLLLTDVVIPGLSGPQLAERLKARHPRLKVLFMTGYSDETITRHGLETSQHEVVQKPFTADALALRVRRALDE
jgi:PAS domain S-box-containing protein